jgi:hypothetical protein
VGHWRIGEPDAARLRVAAAHADGSRYAHLAIAAGSRRGENAEGG